MEILKDYNFYIKSNKSFLNSLNENNFISYYRFEDAFKIINYIETLYNKENKINDELQVILENALDYVYENLETIKTYFNEYCNKDYFLLKKYDSIIDYLLYLEDLSSALKEKNAYNEEVILPIYKKLENVLINKEEFSEEDLLEIDNKITISFSNKDILTISEIFGMICEELDL